MTSGEIGIFFTCKNQIAEAERDCRRAVELDPNSRMAHRGYSSQKQDNETIQRFKTAYQKSGWQGVLLERDRTDDGNYFRRAGWNARLSRSKLCRKIRNAHEKIRNAHEVSVQDLVNLAIKATLTPCAFLLCSREC